MQNISFKDIPYRYQALLERITSSTLKKIYSQFTFLYLSLNDEKPIEDLFCTQHKNQIVNYLFSFLSQSKFITYNIFNIFKYQENLPSKHDNTILDVVFCIEKRCIIIDGIEDALLKLIIERLLEKQISIINFDKNSAHRDGIYTSEEVSNFCNNFSCDLNNNNFVYKTIIPIAGYLIRRHFYPTTYFNDPSFFTFDSQANTSETQLKNKIGNYLLSKTEDDKKKNFLQLFQSKEEDNNNALYEFNEKDFIKLRIIYYCNEAAYYLAIHIESLYIFMMKKTFENAERGHEHDFCQNYSHRCFCHFYGFLKRNNEKIGYIYEYLSNGSLNSYIASNIDKDSQLFNLMTINRIAQGIEYLQKNNLIHRNLKPSNILLDHDNIPYITDFDTIRHIINEDDPKYDLEMTNDIGSVLYSSPEQDEGDYISFPTDIYSYGLILYYILEGKSMWSYKGRAFFDKSKNNTIIKMTRASQNLENLYEQCIKLQPNERPNIRSIIEILSTELNSFDYLINDLKDNTDTINVPQIVQFFYENFHIFANMQDSRDILMNNIFFYQPLFKAKIERNTSIFYSELAKLYLEGSCFTQDYLKAIHYLELSQNSEALFNLGKIYEKGLGVSVNYKKAKDFYELAARKGNSEALLKLDCFYEKGLGVDKDSKKAKQYFKLAGG